jgi:hypothetical protein
MISARSALLRQAQSYFHQYLLGVIPWDSVVVDKPIPIPPVKGQREQGKFRDVVSCHFRGFRMELFGPFEDERYPLGLVRIERAGDFYAGPLDATSWALVADFIKLKMIQGEDHGEVTEPVAGGADWGR